MLKFWHKLFWIWSLCVLLLPCVYSLYYENRWYMFPLLAFEISYWLYIMWYCFLCFNLDKYARNHPDTFSVILPHAFLLVILISMSFSFNPVHNFVEVLVIEVLIRLADFLGFYVFYDFCSKEYKSHRTTTQPTLIIYEQV